LNDLKDYDIPKDGAGGMRRSAEQVDSADRNSALAKEIRQA